MNLLILGLVDGNLLQDDSGFIASPTPGDHFYIIWYFLLGFRVQHNYTGVYTSSHAKTTI